MMKKMVEQWNLETKGCPNTSSFKGKFTAQSEKPGGKTKGHKGNANREQEGRIGSTAVRPPPRATRGGL